MNKTSIFLLSFCFLAFTTAKHEEGMFPLSHLSSLDLEKAGLKISPEEIYNENGKSLVNALVRLGGCTGSFISNQGLIITNHHCVFGTVADLSTPENNYLENGFYAGDTSGELKTSIPCKITVSFKDVSTEVLAGIEGLSPQEKTKKIAANRKALIDADKIEYPELSIEVSEMLVGKSYTLFRYKVLNDVRIVYVPPQNIGKFGGETDNWEWPRHNGDFSIVRAYENGKPFKPKQHLQVNPEGTKEGDFTFILGYPGTTYRNQPAQFLEYQQNFVLPIISDWFDFRIAAIKNHVADDKGLQLEYAGTMASLSNVSKNFKGKMQGLGRTDVIAKVKSAQEEMKKFATSREEFKSYLPLFSKIEELYRVKFTMAESYLYLGQLFNNVELFKAAALITVYRDELVSISGKERKTYIERNAEEIKNKFMDYMHLESGLVLDKLYFQELMYRLKKTGDNKINIALNEIKGQDKEDIYAGAGELYLKSGLYDISGNTKLISLKTAKFLNKKSELIELAGRLLTIMREIQSETARINAEIDEIIPRFNDIEMAINGAEFIPDANGTLRFTYGYVKGYRPDDAVNFEPFTTVQGILDKSMGSNNPDYFLQSEYIQKLKEIEPADVLKHPKQQSVVVAFLYNMDTTGGNSGSPIMDAYGRLVGVNFDRAYTATINDYAWNEAYSRSIGVDIRYVLYVIKYFGEADSLLEEMNVVLR